MLKALVLCGGLGSWGGWDLKPLRRSVGACSMDLSYVNDHPVVETFHYSAGGLLGVFVSLWSAHPKTLLLFAKKAETGNRKSELSGGGAVLPPVPLACMVVQEGHKGSGLGSAK